MASPGRHPGRPAWRAPLRTLVGTLLTVAAAFAAAWVFQHAEHRTVAPLVFVLVLVVIAGNFGRLPAFLGTLFAAAVFAWFLFPPLGSIAVSDGEARRSVAWMLLLGLVLADFVPALWGPTRKHR